MEADAGGGSYEDWEQKCYEESLQRGYTPSRIPDNHAESIHNRNNEIRREAQKGQPSNAIIEFVQGLTGLASSAVIFFLRGVVESWQS